jgi:hypothetical protein
MLAVCVSNYLDLFSLIVDGGGMEEDWKIPGARFWVCRIYVDAVLNVLISCEPHVQFVTR